jgi:hypothetical protein
MHAPDHCPAQLGWCCLGKCSSLQSTRLLQNIPTCNDVPAASQWRLLSMVACLRKPLPAIHHNRWQCIHAMSITQALPPTGCESKQHALSQLCSAKLKASKVCQIKSIKGMTS